MKVREINVRSALTKTAIEGFDYCLNPFIGCAHACRYCYAVFMKRFSGHPEPWGQFVDIKINAPLVLGKQIVHAKIGEVAVGTVTDPYQPVEKEYHVTRDCLKPLLERQFPVNILTRSGLCLRDIDLFQQFHNITIGLSITTDNEKVRAAFEPFSPPIRSRIDTLAILHQSGIRTYAFIGPLLPMSDPVSFAKFLVPNVDEVLIDRLNYKSKVTSIYRQYGWQNYLNDNYFTDTALRLKGYLEENGVEVSVLF